MSLLETRRDILAVERCELGYCPDTSLLSLDVTGKIFSVEGEVLDLGVVHRLAFRVSDVPILISALAAALATISEWERKNSGDNKT